MGRVKDSKSSAPVEALYKELLGMKERIIAMRRDFAAFYGPNTEMTMLHERHLRELADIVDWKLHILSAGSPVGAVEGGEAADTVVSVSQPDVTGPDFSGGYLGG